MNTCQPTDTWKSLECQVRESIHRLTNEHFWDGRMRPSLLDQIQGAAQPDRTGGAAHSSTELKIPVDVGAISLYQDIERRARDDHWRLFKEDPKPLAEVIQAFDIVITKDELPEWPEYLANLTDAWANQIYDYLNPTKPPRKINRPCPSCGEHLFGEKREIALVLYCYAEDGTMLKWGQWSVECRSCTARWESDQLDWLSSALQI